jgi:hypothetical protein
MAASQSGLQTGIKGPFNPSNYTYLVVTPALVEAFNSASTSDTRALKISIINGFSHQAF